VTLSIPTVSVVIPNYNHAAYIRQRIESVLVQTYQDFELIILDDASTDNSRDIVAPFAADSRIRVEFNPINSGSPFIQWNRGVALATGTYVWIAESDDFAASNFLATLVPMLERDPACVIAYCQSWRVDEQDTVLGTLADEWDPQLEPARWEKPFVADGIAECARYLIWKNTIPNASAAVFRRQHYLDCGGAPESMRLCGDWMLWAHLLLRGGIAFTPERLNYFRHHPGTVRAATAWAKHAREQWAIQAFVLRSCPVPFQTQRRLARQTTTQVLDQVLPAPRGKRLDTLRSCLGVCGPILARSPIATAETVIRRYGAAAKRRLVGASGSITP
jgi:glycosyltransferase involved in cell wall biosynthesis